VRCSSGEALRSNLCGKNSSRLPKSCFLCVCGGGGILSFSSASQMLRLRI
jgi:hypothetical protein